MLEEKGTLPLRSIFRMEIKIAGDDFCDGHW